MPDVVVYYARDCHLCERALATVREVGAELGLSPVEVDITGEEELEARYREFLPVVEIDGARAFMYFVDPLALRRKLVTKSR